MSLVLSFLVASKLPKRTVEGFKDEREHDFWVGRESKSRVKLRKA